MLLGNEVGDGEGMELLEVAVREGEGWRLRLSRVAVGDGVLERVVGEGSGEVVEEGGGLKEKVEFG